MADVVQAAALPQTKIDAGLGDVVPETAREIAARCVQCGLCNAVCPTFLLEGDERDGPRGRITMMRRMFEEGQAPTPDVRFHVGRCLGCMACVTACPAKVDYAQLFRQASIHIRRSAAPSPRERLVNWFVASVLPVPRRLGWAVRLAPTGLPLGRLVRWAGFGDLVAVARSLAEVRPARPVFSGAGTAETTRERRGRVILLPGCAQQVLRPGINDATIRLLARNGIDVEVAAGAPCCGAPRLDSGDPEAARRAARATIDAWMKSISRNPADAILLNSAGCGRAVKTYPALLQDDPDYRDSARVIAGLARDVCEFLGAFGLGPPRRWSSLKVAYMAPCHLHHGQGVVDVPAALIHEAGFTVVELPETGVCCGASGTYTFREPELAGRLRERKADHILALRPDVVATASIACLRHLKPATGTPIVHVVEMLDWAYGGPVPEGLDALAGGITDVPGPPPRTVEEYIRV